MSCFRMVLAASFGNTYNVTCIIMTYGRMAVWRHRDSEGFLSFYVWPLHHIPSIIVGLQLTRKPLSNHFSVLPRIATLYVCM